MLTNDDAERLLQTLTGLLDTMPGFASDGRPEYLPPKAAEAYADALQAARTVEADMLVKLGRHIVQSRRRRS